ncbi:conserved hypothetical protein [Talaromyces stipitatus ATCC 10500]|uniref:Glutamine amidotransferase domain-containing protein n=1 Tax=Talaromyces stipitatus (strain ATCC 10500 / CBS 375.48 / QM 6759 / NRRL 1006) TaxID=441959 RepID=B8LZ05_TALSN|nr:uncharacterized protein TSTA_069340 [Talaromyces stipitatus ATCC 10500]EED23513.1 conserved hypothetical protein [Talaromyces stipitatus ATCC 10500]
MPTRHIHIAILDTDVPVPAVYTARARRLNQNIRDNSAIAQQVQIHTSAYDVVGGSYPGMGMLRKTTPCLEEEQEEVEEEETFRPIDAILITGSAASAYYQGEQYAWISKLQEFIRRVWSRFPLVKFFGSCFGHQVIAQALLVNTKDAQSLVSPQVRVEACPMGYEIGIHPVTLSPEFTPTTLGKAFTSRLGSNNGKLHIQLIHGDRVVGFYPSHTTAETSAVTLSALPKPWLNLGSTPLSPIQGLYYPGRVLTYQGHFEFDVFVNCETVIEFGRRAGWDAQMVTESLRKINGFEDDDSRLAAEIVVQFLAGGDDNSGQGVDVPMKISYSMKEDMVRSVVSNGLVTPPDEMSMQV